MVIMMIHLNEYISYSVDKKHNHKSLMIETKNHAKMKNMPIIKQTINCTIYHVYKVKYIDFNMLYCITFKNNSV